MLSPADQQIVERDPALPGLAVLLDAERLTERLRAMAPEAGVTASEPRYLRYKPGTSCVAGYEVRAGTATVFLYARAHDAAVAVKLDKAEQRRSVASPFGPGITLWRDEAIAVYPFPNDHDLKRLPTVIDRGERHELLARMLCEHPELHDADLTTLRYKPERRYVGRLVGNGGASAMIRLYTEHRFDEACLRHGLFQSTDAVRVPAVLGRTSKMRVVAIEWIDGRPLPEMLEGEGAGEVACRAAGRALAGLHAQRPKRIAECTSGDFLQSVRAACEAVATVQPELAERLERTQERLDRRLSRRPWRRRALHGDFSADQVLLHDGRVAIVDYDRACRGDPRIDLATFAAKLDYDVIGGTISEHRADACREALLDAYELASPRDLTGHLWLFAGACLLRLTPEPFRHRLSDWPAITAALVERAEERIRGAIGH